MNDEYLSGYFYSSLGVLGVLGGTHLDLHHQDSKSAR